MASSVFGVDMAEMQSARIPAEQMDAVKQATAGDKGQLIIQEILKLPLLKNVCVVYFLLFRRLYVIQFSFCSSWRSRR